MALGDRARAVDVVVGDDEHAASLRPRIRRDADRVVDVQRPVGADRRRRPHRADEDDRLVALHDEIEEVRRFLHRVGAVRDRDAVDIGLREQPLTSAASLSQTSSFMSWLPTEDTCTPRTSANFFICGTALISTSTATAPDLYPAAVVDSAAPAMVPPVATMTIRGFCPSAPPDAVHDSNATTARTEIPHHFFRDIVPCIMISPCCPNARNG